MDPIDASTSYLEALVRRDPGDVPFAPGVRRINNGRVAVEGADALREVIRREPPLTMGALRWVSTGDEAAVFYDLQADMGGDALVTASIGERFVVRDGRIEEIEVVYSGTRGGPSPWGARRATGPSADVMATARVYLDALVSHRAADVPLAGGVRRVENGSVTGDGADHLRTSLESEIMRSVQSIDGERWIQAGDEAVVFYDLHARYGDTDMAVRIAERFRANQGELTEIEAVFAPVTQGP